MTPNQETGFPLYIKLPLILLGLVLTTYILSGLADILIPLAFAVLIAILLNPLYVRMEKKIPKVPAIIFSILLAIFFLV
jgi:predicted PurR-regulated permease PerM